MDMDVEKEIKQLEKDELNMLIGRGAEFVITYRKKEREKGLIGLFKKRKWVDKYKKFEIKQPTLAVLNRISAESIELHLDEVALSKGDMSTLNAARESIVKNTDRMARIIAIAVIGEDYYNHESKKYEKGYEAAIKHYAEIFVHTIKPSQLLKITSTITNISNLADFINSTRLMSTRTTDVRVE